MPVSLSVTEPALAAHLPLEVDLGPAMKALPERHRLFVIACLGMGAKVNYAKAARASGYALGKEGQATLRVRGHRLAHSPRIQAAMREEALNMINAGTVASAALLVSTVGNSRAPIKDRLKASTAILDRAGLGAISEHRVIVNHHDDRQSKVLRLAALAVAAGEDPKRVLGNLADALEGDFKVLEKDAVPDAELALDDPATIPAAPVAATVEE